MNEFDMQNAEAVAVVRNGQQLPRAKCHFIPEAEYKRMKRMEREAILAESMKAEQAEREPLVRTVGGAMRCVTGIIFGGAIAEGLIDPLFGGICVAACILWGIVHAFGGKRNA